MIPLNKNLREKFYSGELDVLSDTLYIEYEFKGRNGNMIVIENIDGVTRITKYYRLLFVGV